MTGRCGVCAFPAVVVSKHGGRFYCLRHVPYDTIVYSVDSLRSYLISSPGGVR
jgi:hypothetical protein